MSPNLGDFLLEYVIQFCFVVLISKDNLNTLKIKKFTYFTNSMKQQHSKIIPDKVPPSGDRGL